MERFELPEGWEWRRLADVSPIDTAPILPKEHAERFFNYIALENIESGTGQLIDFEPTKGANIKSNKFCFNTKHVLLGKLRPYLNKVFVPNFEGICATDILPLLPNSERLTREFLAICLRSPDFVEYSKVKMEGAKMPRLRTPDLEAYQIPISPLPEQRRIVARIEELTRRVEEARRQRQEAISKITSFVPSLLDTLFELAESKGWKKARIGDENISTIIMGQSPEGNSYNRDGIGVPLLNGPTEFGARYPTPVQWTTESARLCQEGDILFCVRGSTTGRMNWADRQYCIGRGLAAIRPNKDNCLPEFLFAFVQTQTAAILHQGEGGVFPNFNKDQLAAIEIPLPPIDEQRRIVKYLNKLQSKAEDLKYLQTETEAELIAFTPALLAKAFQGEL